MTTPRWGTLFHFTHMANLGAILSAGELVCDSTVCEAGLLSCEAGDPEIKAERRLRRVPVPPHGVVADYVPFYFAARSPMMFKLSRGGVPSFKGDHHDLVYFVTSVDRLVEGGHSIVITDRNAAKYIADFTDDIAVLGDLAATDPGAEFIDWPLMQARIWRNTPDDPERMERRMAEVLVHGRVPLDVMSEIGVYAGSQAQGVRSLIQETARTIEVREHPDWYY